MKFRKYFLEALFEYGLTVVDRSPTGRPHFHVFAVGSAKVDFHSGFNFAAWEQSRIAERRWNNSGHTDHAAERQWRDFTAACNASASSDLRPAWQFLQAAAEQCGLGRINALPIKNPVACGFYLAKCVTNGFRDNHPEDRGVRRVRYWGNFPRKVSLKFHRVTKGATRWRGKLAFCAHVLGFTEFDDFQKCFGSQWFIHLKGIVGLVPIPIAEASLLSCNLPLDLIENFRDRIEKIETELRDRVERYGRSIQHTH